MKRSFALILMTVLLVVCTGCSPNEDSSSQPEGSVSSLLADLLDQTDMKSSSALQEDKNYFSEHGIPVKDQYGYVETKCISYEFGFPDHQEVTTIAFEPYLVTDELDPENSNYKIITLKMSASAQVAYDSMKKEAMSLYFTSALFDLYTGQMFPIENLDGSQTSEKSIVIEYEGQSIELSYSQSNVWEWNLFEEEEKLLHICNITYVVRAPVEYDGLVFGAIARTYYSPEEEDENSNPDYVTDLEEMEQFDLSESRFFRFGQENPADEGTHTAFEEE